MWGDAGHAGAVTDFGERVADAAVVEGAASVGAGEDEARPVGLTVDQKRGVSGKLPVLRAGLGV